MAVRHVGGWKPGDRNTFASDYSVCVPSSASVWSGSRSRRAGAPPSPARGRGRRPSRAVSCGPRGRAGCPPPARRRRRGRSGRGAIPVVRVEESVKERTCHGYTIHNAAILWLWHVTAWVIVRTKDRHRVPDLIGGTERYVGVKVSIKIRRFGFSVTRAVHQARRFRDNRSRAPADSLFHCLRKLLLVDVQIRLSDKQRRVAGQRGFGPIAIPLVVPIRRTRTASTNDHSATQGIRRYENTSWAIWPTGVLQRTNLDSRWFKDTRPIRRLFQFRFETRGVAEPHLPLALRRLDRDLTWINLGRVNGRSAEAAWTQ
jgi:hypothetical protein